MDPAAYTSAEWAKEGDVPMIREEGIEKYRAYLQANHRERYLTWSDLFYTYRMGGLRIYQEFPHIIEIIRRGGYHD